MNSLLQVIGFACLAHLITDFIEHMQWSLPDKPFKCDMCMGYWISVIPFVIQFGLSGFLLSAITAIISKLIFKYTV